jgi:hypothetical protein
MTYSCQWPLLMCALMLTTPSLAADQPPVAPPAHERHVVVAPPPPVLLPPCREAFWATSLYCVPRAEAYAPHDPYLHSYLRSLRPVQRKPYVQVFSW